MSHPAREAGDACKECAEVPEAGRARCTAHLARHREKEAVRRAERKATAKCVTCGRRTKKGRTLCDAHLAYYAARN